ncbi:MAG: hypothetical protein AMXMBFR83_30950 [Phycisphaerae bacterium]
MQCPFCESENIDGADFCEVCNESLTGVEAGHPRATLEQRIARAPVALLQPSVAVTVDPADTVGEVVALLARRNFGCALVARDDKLLGIFTERDALMKIGASIEEVGQEPIARFMTPNPETLSFSDTIAFALNRMAVGDYRHIPIHREGLPLGIISVRDMLNYLTRSHPGLLGDEPPR